MAPTHRLRVKNGPKSEPINLKMAVNGVIDHPDGNGKLSLTIENEEVTIPFRGRITKFKFSGEGSIWIEGVQFAARDVKGYDTRTGVPTSIPTKDQPVPKPPSPSDPPASKDTSTPNIDEVDKGEVIGGGTYIDVGDNAVPSDGFVSRYATTVQDRTITVDASESGGVQNALNRLPYRIQHDITIELGNGTHSGNGSSCRTGPLAINSRGYLKLYGTGVDQCQVTSGINGVYWGKQEHNRIKDIHWGSLSQFSGPVHLRDCRFEGFDEPGANAETTAAISGKNGLVFAKGCVIGSATDDTAIHATLQEKYSLANTTLRAGGTGIIMPDGSVCDVSYGCKLDAPSMSSEEAKIQRGRYRGGKFIG